MQEFKNWYYNYPLITRSYLTLIIFFSLLNRFQIVYFETLLFDPDSILKLQVWRLWTDYFILGNFNFDYILALILISFSFSNMESIQQGPLLSDFVYMLLYQVAFIDILALIFRQNTLATALNFALTYIWCNKKPFHIVKTYFGLNVQSAYFPWILMIYHVIFGQNIYLALFGLAAGHSYLVLKDFLPLTHQKNILRTPKFIKILVQKFILPYTQNQNNQPPVQ